VARVGHRWMAGILHCAAHRYIHPLHVIAECADAGRLELPAIKEHQLYGGHPISEIGLRNQPDGGSDPAGVGIAQDSRGAAEIVNVDGRRSRLG
jgi:hypothetical protein